MIDISVGTEMLVNIATFTYVLGFLFRNQIILRGLVLIGTGFYIAYYYLHLDAPQWEAMLGSCMIGVATIIGLCSLIYSRVPIGIQGNRRQIYDAFGVLEPGEFRKLMKNGRLERNRRPVTLTTQGVRPDNLYFVLAGSPVVDKDGRQFDIPHNCFIGEVGFLLGQTASATVVLPAGGTYVEWERGRLIRLLDRSPKLRQAFEAMIGRDLADKVAQSVRVRNIPIIPPAKSRTPEQQEAEQSIIASLA